MAERYTEISLHKSVGLLIIGVTMLRLLVRAGFGLVEWSEVIT